MSILVMCSFLGFLATFLLVGLFSVKKRIKSTEDYLLASREISPAFVGLSGAASTASGFGFTGIIGFGYVMGLSGSWFIAGLILGSIVGLSISSRRFRTFSQRHKCSSYIEYLAFNVSGTKRILHILMGVLSILALVLYATAQFTAGSKALHVLFGWHYNTGAILGAIIVLLYCWAGGIRASIWTDVAQIVVMFLSMLLLAIVSLSHIGGFTGLFHSLAIIDPDLVSLFPRNNSFGPLLFVLGCISVGFSFIGFPHVMVRFMTLKNPRDTVRAIAWFEVSYAAFYITAYVVALCTRVLLPDMASFDKELALPELAQSMLPDVLVGVILAGIFAGTISTADSLILSSTANLSRDIFHRQKGSYSFLKWSTFFTTVAALLVALFGSKSVFDLVLFVIAIMGAGFAPLMVIRTLNWKIVEPVAIAMILGGLAAAVWWRYMGYHKEVFDVFPGMVAAFVIYGLGRLLSAIKRKYISD